MSDIEEYDVVILGSGEAGKYLAWTLGGLGKRTAMIERRYIGGSCPNIACLPSKNVIHSAKVASYFRRADEFGIRAGEWNVDMAGVRLRKRKMVDDLIAIHLARYEASGTELVMGEGTFIAPRTIEVLLPTGARRTLKGKQVVLSTGSRATLPDIRGLVDSSPMTHIEALELDVVPQHLLLLGGGYIGLEFAQAIRRFGSRVTLVERSDRLARREDSDISSALLELCMEEGIEVLTEARVLGVEGVSGQHVRLDVEQKGLRLKIEGTHLLVAAGRTPNTDGLGLELSGVQTDELGFIKVNDRLETTAAGVWAVGDCAGSPQFTHIAFDDFRIVRDNISGGTRTKNGRLVPFCMFTDPEFARVGLSETEAQEQGIAYRLFRIPMGAILRTRTLSEMRGFMKALVAVDSDRILGFTAFGVNAGELIGIVQLAITSGIPYTALRDSVLIHPTMSEGFTVLFATKPVS